MSAVADFIRRNPERARGLEQMTTYVPYLFADGMSLVQSQAALTVSRLASLMVSVCLHDNPQLQTHVAALQRELSAATAAGSLPSAAALNGGLSMSTSGILNTPASSVSSRRRRRSTRRSAADGGDAASPNSADGAALDDDDEEEEDEEDDSNSNSPDDNNHLPSSVANLAAKYSDPRSRALINHYKRTVAAELGVLFLSEVEVLIELLIRSKGFQTVLASHNLGQCLSDEGCVSNGAAVAAAKLKGLLGGGSGGSSSSAATSITPPKPTNSRILNTRKASPAVTGRIGALLSGSAPIPPNRTIHQRSRRAGWIVCWTITLIKSILRLYMQRSTLSAAFRSLVAHLQIVLSRMCGQFKRLMPFGSDDGSRKMIKGGGGSAVATTAVGADGLLEGGREGSPSPSAPHVGSDGGHYHHHAPRAGGSVGRAPSSGLVIPRVTVGNGMMVGGGGGLPDSTSSSVGGGHISRASPARRAASLSQLSLTNTNSNTPTTSNNTSQVYLFSFKEYLAVLIDTFHATKPFIWAVVACLSRNPSAGMLRMAGGTSSSVTAAAGSNNFNNHTLQAFASMMQSVPRLFQPSWRGWCGVMGLELSAFVLSVWLKLSRHPVVVIGGVHNATSSSALAANAAGAGDGNTNNVVTAASAAAASVNGGIDNLPMTAEKDHARVMRCVRNIILSTLQDPFFTVVLKETMVDNLVEGGIARVPIIGGIIGAQVMMYMLRRDASFLASNF